jgi:hypothetical protein
MMKNLHWPRAGSAALLVGGLLAAGCAPPAEQPTAPDAAQPAARGPASPSAAAPGLKQAPEGDLRTVALRVEGMT